MVWAVNAALYVALTVRSGGSDRLAAGIFTWTVVASCVYFVAGFDFFIGLYAISVTGVVITSIWQAGRSNKATERARHRAFAAASLGLYVGGFLFLWLPEQYFCGNRLERTAPSALESWHLHAWFHLTSALGPYFYMSFVAMAWRDASNQRSWVSWERCPETLFLVRLPVVRDV